MRTAIFSPRKVSTVNKFEVENEFQKKICNFFSNSHFNINVRIVFLKDCWHDDFAFCNI